MTAFVTIIPDDTGGPSIDPDVVTPTADTTGLIRAGTDGRTGGGKLDGSTIGADPRYVFLSAGASGAVRVTWYLDGVSYRTDLAAPWDFETPLAGDVPAPLHDLADGSHTISARYANAAGDVFWVVATFTATDMDAGTVEPPTGGFRGDRATSSVKAAIGLGQRSPESVWESALGRQVNFYLQYPGWRGLHFGQTIDAAKGILGASWKSSNWTCVMTIGLMAENATPLARLADTLDNGTAVTSDLRTLKFGAQGGYDPLWQELADYVDTLTDAQLQRLVMSVAWEFPGTWYPWSTEGYPGSVTLTDAEKTALRGYFRTYWRRVRAIFDATLGTRKNLLLWELVFQAGYSNSAGLLSRMEDAWPGDDVVDIAGGDIYAMQSGTSLAQMTAALDWLLDFATRHNKLVAVSETGTGAKPLMAPGDSWKSAWASGTTFAAGNVVLDDDELWRSLQAGNAGHKPSDSPTWWTPAYRWKGAHSLATTYGKGDWVGSGGKTYVSKIASNTGNAVTVTSAWGPATEGIGDEPLAADAWLDWMTRAHAAGRLLFLNIFEHDVPREKLWATILKRTWTMPGKESTVIAGTTLPANFPALGARFLELFKGAA